MKYNNEEHDFENKLRNIKKIENFESTINIKLGLILQSTEKIEDISNRVNWEIRDIQKGS